MKKFMLVSLAMILTLSAFSLPSVTKSIQVRQTHAQGITPEGEDFVVFQAAGPTVEAIQGSVDQFRAALGDPNNANAAASDLKSSSTAFLTALYLR